jgi:hypothetical protein
MFYFFLSFGSFIFQVTVGGTITVLLNNSIWHLFKRIFEFSGLEPNDYRSLIPQYIDFKVIGIVDDLYMYNPNHGATMIAYMDYDSFLEYV